MRGVGTAVNGIFPGYLRRTDPGAPVGLNGPSIGTWTLITKETAAQVEAANYFNAHVAVLPKGTPIDACMDIAGATPKRKNYIVTGNDGTTVTVALQATTAG